jgi:hypothetical protein
MRIAKDVYRSLGSGYSAEVYDRSMRSTWMTSSRARRPCENLVSRVKDEEPDSRHHFVHTASAGKVDGRISHDTQENRLYTLRFNPVMRMPL